MFYMLIFLYVLSHIIVAAIALFVYSRIASLQAFLSSGRRNPLVSSEINQILDEENCNKELFVTLFSQAFLLAYEKCEKHIFHHPALSLFKTIRCFDPRFIQSNAIYCRLNEPIEELLDLKVYWQGKTHLLPELSAIALVYIWLPVSGVNVECNINYELLDRE
ncbi:hypothetical protein C1645_816656 [Glomus cerebriforme]|uniref:Uncharacterized protein n=1 Tax=Glomus cerebriforme TaxID=658196 RepID=A0A397TER1_9GLOM|nr:hypothetical protein C1645_816656 [Glomus cerebriforme]